ncbi:MAG: TIGR03013 family XrtA/PEP-CTERM system glycosyltransferase [Pseudomonadales bacterium]
MSLIEAALLLVAALGGYYTRFQSMPSFEGYWPFAVTFALVNVVGMAAMGVYASRVREGYIGMMLRTAVSMFLLATAALAVLSYLAPKFGVGRGVLLFSTMEGFVLLALWRWITARILGEDALKRRVLVLGTGERALSIARRMRRRSDRRAFVLEGFLKDSGEEDRVSEFAARVLSSQQNLPDYCRERDIDEIVVARDDNRSGNAPGLPLDELVECRFSGIEVCDVQAFVEREANRIDVDLLQPSWIIFSDGFVSRPSRALVKRVFDILISLLLLLLTWPVMLIAALVIAIAGGFREPVLYKQKRVGLHGALFEELKFRSMRTDAESDGAPQWAAVNDPRITKVGGFLRTTRIDELPQLFNVLRGEMSFVGPRPERPEFVVELTEQIPYYEQRHRLKPGITGWAQLCYPYGASVSDAKEKLQFDLYYLKNQSLLLDLIILFQTVEVVLVGEGAR